MGSRGRCGGHVLRCGEASVCPAHAAAPRTHSSYECCKGPPSPRHLAWPSQGPLPSLAGHPAPRCSLVALRDREHCFPGQILGRPSALPLSGASHQSPAQPAGPQWPSRDTERGCTLCWGCSGRMCSVWVRAGPPVPGGRAGGESCSVPSRSWGTAGSPRTWGRDMGVSQGRAQQAGTSNPPCRLSQRERSALSSARHKCVLRGASGGGGGHGPPGSAGSHGDSR